MNVPLNVLVESEGAAEMHLLWHRAALCDLLLGRRLRNTAQVMLERALVLERFCAPRGAVDEMLWQAAHTEWIAAHAERGHILWGGRVNRCGSVAA